MRLRAALLQARDAIGVSCGQTDLDFSSLGALGCLETQFVRQRRSTWKQAVISSQGAVASRKTLVARHLVVSYGEDQAARHVVVPRGGRGAPAQYPVRGKLAPCRRSGALSL